MREYPYIGKLNDKYESDGTVLFTKEGYGCALNSEGKGWYKENIFKYGVDEWLESEFTNITKDYLENKCVKIESPEHSEFVQKLAFKAGYSWHRGDTTLQHTGKVWLHFWRDGDICYGDDPDFEQIQLPMPPTSNLQEEDVEEWKPVVGDVVSLRYRHDSKEVHCTGELLYLSNRHIIIQGESADIHKLRCDYDIEKPLSKEDVILQEITTFLEDAVGLGSKVTAMGLVEKFKIEMK